MDFALEKYIVYRRHQDFVFEKKKPSLLEDPASLNPLIKMIRKVCIKQPIIYK